MIFNGARSYASIDIQLKKICVLIIRRIFVYDIMYHTFSNFDTVSNGIVAMATMTTHIFKIYVEGQFNKNIQS